MGNRKITTTQIHLFISPHFLDMENRHNLPLTATSNYLTSVVVELSPKADQNVRLDSNRKLLVRYPTKRDSKKSKR